MNNTVALIDDHDLLRKGLRSFLEQNSSWRVIHEAGTAAEAISFFESADQLPAAVIVDISLPDLDGIDLVRRLRQISPKTSFIMYSMHITAEYIHSALNAGAVSYVSKASPADEVLHALDAARLGNPYLDNSSLKIHLSQFAADKLRNEPTPNELRESLTLQEDRVFLLAAKNLSNTEIAGTLNLKVKTVENYMSLIYQKLSLRNRYELLEFARKAGIHR